MTRTVADHPRRCNRCYLIRSASDCFCTCGNGDFTVTGLSVGTRADELALQREREGEALREGEAPAEPCLKPRSQRKRRPRADE